MPEQQLSILDVGDFKFYSVTSHGITFRPATPKNFWLEAVQKLCGMFEGAEMTKQKALMMLADALNYGQDAYGEDFSQAVEGMRQALGLTPKTIANAQAVYKKIDASRRRDGLRLGHFSVIAPLPPEEQDKLMDKALADPKHTFTVDELKSEVAAIHPKTKRGKTRKTKAQPDDGDTAETILHKLSDCSDWFMSNEPIEKMKPSAQVIYKAYRRQWMGGHKK